MASQRPQACLFLLAGTVAWQRSHCQRLDNLVTCSEGVVTCTSRCASYWIRPAAVFHGVCTTLAGGVEDMLQAGPFGCQTAVWGEAQSLAVVCMPTAGTGP